MNLQFSIQDICNILRVEPPPAANPSFQIRNVILDSRSPRMSVVSLFFCLKGQKTDGHEYLEDAQKKGVKFAIVDHYVEGFDIVQIVVDDVLNALQILASEHRSRFNYPVIGITGSNGKTIVKE